MKRISAFLFALGVSLAFGAASARSNDCYDSCDAALEHCVAAYPTSIGMCTKLHSICLAECDSP
jgi:hypothetical protein